MKLRLGFVSNSSSSSFTCLNCGETFIGYNGEYDVDRITCEDFDHQFCGNCLDIVDTDDGVISGGICPMCNFQILDEKIGLEYLLIKEQMTRKSLLKEMKGNNQNYSEFMEKLRESRNDQKMTRKSLLEDS